MLQRRYTLWSTSAQPTACGSLDGGAQPKTLSGRTRQRRMGAAPIVADSPVSHWRRSSADILDQASLSSIPQPRARLRSAMAHGANDLLEPGASAPSASRMWSCGESWNTRRSGIVSNPILGYDAAPGGRVFRLCLLDSVLPQRALIQGYSIERRQIKTLLSYLGGSAPHN